MKVYRNLLGGIRLKVPIRSRAAPSVLSHYVVGLLYFEITWLRRHTACSSSLKGSSRTPVEVANTELALSSAAVNCKGQAVGRILLITPQVNVIYVLVLRVLLVVVAVVTTRKLRQQLQLVATRRAKARTIFVQATPANNNV
jgi:hypothetical protein